MAINFPTSPAVSDTYQVDAVGRIWKWNGSGWEQFLNFGQIGLAFVPIYVLIEETIGELPGETLANGAWGLVDYV